MNEQLLADALASDERLAPDPHDVLAGMAGGIRRRRQRRLAGYAASVLAVLALAGGLVVTVPWQAEQAASPAPIPTPDFQRTVRFGWLPDGLSPPTYSASDTGEEVLYPMSGAVYLRVAVSHVDWQPKLDKSGWQQIQVGGRPGRLVSRPTRTLILWQLPSGHWADLEFGRGGPGGGDSQPAVQTDAERIAAGVTEGAPEPVRLAFELTHLPAGMRIVGITGATPDGYGNIEITSGSEEAINTAEGITEDGIVYDFPMLDRSGRITVSFAPGAWSASNPPPGVTRFADIGGKAAFRLGQDKGVAVDWPPHGFVQVWQPAMAKVDGPAIAPLLTLDEFRAVASGIRWLGP
ncbi:hypothetical protein [Virgisporangium aurantiacum]|uniref:Uncharacterized protein n=1 Tax=Virgisporangium aurantiacum TaxID=175570 RepID=A0A8J3Z0V6_9ACTN|nr:hypothetical protein [Virgisporangium aurantiacum]GIJ53265.1 hypothetical protein Vau01_007810 [Virgisporangium aurantiacum]